MGHHPACHASLGSSFRDVPTVVRYIVKKNTYMGFVKDLPKFHILSPRQIKPDTLRKSLESVPSWIEQIRSWTEKFILDQKEDTKQPKLSRSTPSEPMQFASPPQSLKSAAHHMFIRNRFFVEEISDCHKHTQAYFEEKHPQVNITVLISANHAYFSFELSKREIRSTSLMVLRLCHQRWKIFLR